jgi:hypothetical protein
MRFYIFGSILFALAMILLVFGVLSKSIKPDQRVIFISIAAIMSVPGFIVIWDFALYKVIWNFWWD